ncbi:hypothetical protein [Streptomyces sp. NPDC048669]|uniref:hypothetical protein n=1 Tax=Streptomyces sp. NPDC048669 TaxID=3155267 RepID=UPI003411FBB4
MTATAPTVTRRPENDRFAELGSAGKFGDDYFIVIDGQDIGGTYWANAHWVEPGRNWSSWGPAGAQGGFRTREDAEQVQVAAYDPADFPPPAPAPEPTPRTPVVLPRQAPVWPSPELAAQVIEHMHAHCPGTPAGDWIIGQDPVDHHVHVVWQMGSMGLYQSGVRGTMLYQWLISLKDGGFIVEASTDEKVFGRPGKHSEIAWWLDISGRSEARFAPKPVVLKLRPETPVRTVDLGRRRPADLQHPLSGEFPESVTFTYKAAGVETKADYPKWSERVPVPGAWLVALANANRPDQTSEEAA